MSDAIYPKWLEAVAQGLAGSSLAGGGVTGLYVALIDTALYTYNPAHQFYPSIAAGIVGTPQELTSKTYVGGLIDAADALFTAVSGATCEALALFIQNAGANTTWRLFAYIDVATGLPVTPDGSNIPITWDPAGIVRL